MAKPSCFRLLTHCARRAASRAAWTAGKSRAINTAMIAITTNSSISVKPRRRIIKTSPSLDQTGRSLGRVERPGKRQRVIRAQTMQEQGRPKPDVGTSCPGFHEDESVRRVRGDRLSWRRPDGVRCLNPRTATDRPLLTIDDADG